MGLGYNPRAPPTFPPRLSKCSLKMALFLDTCPRPRVRSHGRATVGPDGGTAEIRAWSETKVPTLSHSGGGTAVQVFSGLSGRFGGICRVHGPPTPIATVFLVLFCCHHPEAPWVEDVPSKSPRPVLSMFSFFSSFSSPPPTRPLGFLSSLRVGCTFTDLGQGHYRVSAPEGTRAPHLSVW